MRRPYGIAGAGRASAHLQAYFRLLKVPYKAWGRRSGSGPGEVLSSCHTIFVLLSDAAIGPFIESHPFLRGRTLVHFSGSLSINGAYAMHPFMPLSSRKLTLAEYQAIPFALEPGVSLKRLVPEFRNPVLRVSKEDRPLYHALCALGANMPVMLWQKALAGLARFGVTRDEAVRYFRASLDNFSSSPDTALTGPIARGDTATINSDITALGKDPYSGIYSAFEKAYRKEKSPRSPQERAQDRISKTVVEPAACIARRTSGRRPLQCTERGHGGRLMRIAPVRHGHRPVAKRVLRSGPANAPVHVRTR